MRERHFRYVQSINSKQLHNLLDASYKSNNEAKEMGGKIGYLLDEELSNKNHKVFRDKHDATYIAFTGTQNYNDIGTDIMLAVGLNGFSNRFNNSTSLVKKVKNKYKDSPVVAIGHSLGGRLAEYVNDNEGVDKVITMNKGAGLFDTFKTIRNNQTDIHSNTDFVSLLSNTQRGGKHINNPGTLILDPLYSHGTNHLKKFKKDQRF